MDIPRLQYSPHARERMRHHGISEDEVEAIVWYPTQRVVWSSSVEHYGFADDGRRFKVVTELTETYVITVTEEQRRRDHRREKEMRRKQRRRYT